MQSSKLKLVYTEVNSDGKEVVRAHQYNHFLGEIEDAAMIKVADEIKGLVEMDYDDVRRINEFSLPAAE